MLISDPTTRRVDTRSLLWGTTITTCVVIGIHWRSISAAKNCGVVGNVSYTYQRVAFPADGKPQQHTEYARLCERMEARMVSLDITLTLPDELAQQAHAKGLLTPQSLEQLIRAEVTRQTTGTPLLDFLPDTDKGDLTEADVSAEIRAYRAERRVARERRH